MAASSKMGANVYYKTLRDRSDDEKRTLMMAFQKAKDPVAHEKKLGDGWMPCSRCRYVLKPRQHFTPGRTTCSKQGVVDAAVGGCDDASPRKPRSSPAKRRHASIESFPVVVCDEDLDTDDPATAVQTGDVADDEHLWRTIDVVIPSLPKYGIAPVPIDPTTGVAAMGVPRPVARHDLSIIRPALEQFDTLTPSQLSAIVGRDIVCANDVCEIDEELDVVFERLLRDQINALELDSAFDAVEDEDEDEYECVQLDSVELVMTRWSLRRVMNALGTAYESKLATRAIKKPAPPNRVVLRASATTSDEDIYRVSVMWAWIVHANMRQLELLVDMPVGTEDVAFVRGAHVDEKLLKDALDAAAKIAGWKLDANIEFSAV
jgi:hypothetical protein